MSQVRRGLLVLLCVALGACGAKSGLRVPEVGADAGRDGGMDAGAIDAGVDAGPPTPDAGPEPEPCVEIPFGPMPQVFRLDFEARIVAADIVFLVDNTGSMGPLIQEVEDSLQVRLIPELAAQVPDLQMAVAIYRDFGFFPFGMLGDEPFEVLQTSTSDEVALQRAVENMFARGGGDEPEAATEALYQLATGEGLEPFIDPATCPEGGVGAACLRPEAVPVVLVFTDAPFHNGPSFPATYTPISPPPHTYPETIMALQSRGIRALGLLVGAGFMLRRTRDDLEALSRDTGAVTPAGEPIVLDLGGGPRPLTSRVVDAVEALVDETLIDVRATVEDEPGDAVDATQFVTGIVAERAIPADGARLVGGEFVDVTPGTRVEYRFEVANDFVTPGPAPQRFGLILVLRDERDVPLRTRRVEIVVPADDGRGCD